MGQCCNGVMTDRDLQTMSLVPTQPFQIQCEQNESMKPKDSNDTPSSPVIMKSERMDDDRITKFLQPRVIKDKYWQIKMYITQIFIAFLQIFEQQTSFAYEVFQSLGPFPFPLTKNSSLITNDPILLDNGQIYIGQWKDGARCGFGKQIFPNNAIYEGEWYDDQANGYGRLVQSNGDYYVGQWKNDLANGKGKYQIQDGSFYDGDWLDDKQHGIGTEIWSGKYKYYGQYIEGLKSGIGKFEWDDGSSYEGDLNDGLPHGKGTFIYSDARKYIGCFDFNEKHGYGELYWADGKCYKGNISSIRIKEMDMENLVGVMVECIKDIGDKVNSMGKVSIYMDKNNDKEFGKMDNKFNGKKVKYYQINEQFVIRRGITESSTKLRGCTQLSKQ